ncbi:flagellin [Bosea sp. 685]|uniref:flagellin n=1 Tax=Bosea sp. 685 TaxID=3080057 RepID=UPI0028931FF3|nr:flagellin [Bosea sp. 685]WNJ92535.1 flagellin [Bosea sp. 685]
MTITSYGTGAYRSAKPNEFVATRSQFDDLQRQLTTQKRSETYGDLGIARGTSLDLNSKISAIDSWQSGIQLATVNLNLQTQAVQNFATMTSETKNDVRSNSYVASASGRSAPQVLAEEKFKQTLDLLNTNVNGRYLFSGRTSDVQPTVSYSEMMDGDGAGRAGLKQLVSERKAADLGTTGLGRLTAAGAGTTATIAEENPAQPYGFKLAGTSTDSAALVPTYNAGPPADIGVNVVGQPLPGESLHIKLNLPDGTQQDVVLTARATGTTGNANDSFEIGADANATAANLRASITAALGTQAATTLSAASTMVAAKNFFDGSVTNPPLRVPGPPFDTATGAPAPGTAANTVIWYQGDDGTDPARSTATVQVDKNQVVGTGARANEEAFRVGLAQFAALAIETFPATDTNSQARYEALTERASNNLGFGGSVQKPAEIITELGTAQSSLAAAKDRNDTTKNYLTTAVSGVENVTTEEVATQILALQNQLQASYQVTSILSKLSLTNYL